MGGPVEQSIPAAEVGKLQLGIGKDPDERLNWALKFAQRSLDELTSWDKDRLRWELYIFAETPIFWWSALPAYYRQVLRPTFGSVGRFAGAAFGAKVPTDVDLWGIRLQFRGILRDLERQDFAQIGPVSITYFVTHVPPGPLQRQSKREELLDMFCPPIYQPHHKREPLKPLEEATIEVKALSKFAELIMGHRGRFHRCAECKVWFAGRVNQQFCGKACQSRVATRLYRKRRAEESSKSKTAGRRKRRQWSTRALSIAP